MSTEVVEQGVVSTALLLRADVARCLWEIGKKADPSRPGLYLTVGISDRKIGGSYVVATDTHVLLAATVSERVEQPGVYRWMDYTKPAKGSLMYQAVYQFTYAPDLDYPNWRRVFPSLEAGEVVGEWKYEAGSFERLTAFNGMALCIDLRLLPRINGEWLITRQRDLYQLVPSRHAPETPDMEYLLMGVRRYDEHDYRYERPSTAREEPEEEEKEG